MTESEQRNENTPQGLLTEDEIADLAGRLWKLDDAMLLEEVDGFFCALIAAPELVLPSAYLPVVFGGSGESDAPQPGEDTGTVQLLMRYWNSIIADFHGADEVHVGYVEEPGTDGVTGRDWARGYLAGTRLSGEAWADFFEDDDSGAVSIPIAAGEVEADWPKTPLSEEENDDLLCSMFAAAAYAYAYFASLRADSAHEAARGSA